MDDGLDIPDFLRADKRPPRPPIIEHEPEPLPQLTPYEIDQRELHAQAQRIRSMWGLRPDHRGKRRPSIKTLVKWLDEGWRGY